MYVLHLIKKARHRNLLENEKTRIITNLPYIYIFTIYVLLSVKASYEDLTDLLNLIVVQSSL